MAHEGFPEQLMKVIVDPALLLDGDNTIVKMNPPFIKLFKIKDPQRQYSLDDFFSEFYSEKCFKRLCTHYTFYEMKTLTGKKVKGILTITPLEDSNLKLVVIRELNALLLAEKTGLSREHKRIKNRIAVIKISFLDSGPVLEDAINYEIIQNSSYVLNLLGVYYMTSIQESMGLFGPFPVVENPQLLSLAYKYELNALESGYQLSDKRLAEKVSSLVVVIYDKEFEDLFLHRRAIRKVIQNIVTKREYQTSKKEKIKEMLYEIQNSILKTERKLLAEAQNRTFEEKIFLMNELLSTKTNLTSLQELFKYIGDIIEKLLDFKFFTAWQFSAENKTLKLVAKRGYRELELNHIPINAKSIVARCYRTGEIQNISDVTQDPDYLQGSPNIKAELAVPIYSLTRRLVLGVLNVETERKEGFNYYDEIILDELAGKINFYLDKEYNERRLILLSQLFSEITTLHEKINFERILALITNFVSQVFNFKQFSIMFLNKKTKRLEIKASIGYDQDLSNFTIPIDSNQSIVARSVREKCIYNFGDVKKLSFYQMVDPEINSELVVPIIVGHQGVGAINIESSQLHAFNASDKHLLEALAKIISSVVSYKEIEQFTMRINYDIWS